MQIPLLCGLVVFSVLAILLRDLLKAAISLAVASIFLAIIFFRTNAPYVGVFEISVVAGLITVLFISTIALTRGRDDVRESKLATLVFPLFFLLFILADVFIMRGLIGEIVAVPGIGEQGTFGDTLWRMRTFDLIGQIGVIFAGVFAVLALFRKEGRNE